MPKKGIKARGNGQGSALRIKNNNWKAIAVVGYNENGNPIRKTKSGFKTKTEALAYIPVLKRAEKKEKPPIKLIEAQTEWWKTVTVSESTMWCYKAGLKLFDELNYVPLADLEIDELQECLDNAEQGKRTKQNAKVALNLVYKWAIPRGYIPNNINMASFLKVGEGETTRKESFTPEQLEILKGAAGQMAWARIIYCHCYLGFRPTALLDLTVKDYNATERAFKGGIKTDAGKNRIVTVSPKIQPYVDSLLLHGGNIFSLDGNPISLKVYRKNFYETMEILGFQAEGEHKYTPHTCRHTFATLMKRVDAPDKDKLELIGHTDVSMLRYYQDVDYNDLRRVTDAL